MICRRHGHRLQRKEFDRCRYRKPHPGWSKGWASVGDRPIVFANFTAKNAMPARYVLERADWAGAAALAFKPSQYPQADSLTRFTRGLGMARSGDLAGAKGEIEAIKALRAAVLGVRPSRKRSPSIS
jgi:hypothetical protein